MRVILLFLFIKKTKLLIIKDILDKIVTFKSCKVNINVNIVFIIMFVGFLYIGEIIYPDLCRIDYPI